MDEWEQCNINQNRKSRIAAGCGEMRAIMRCRLLTARLVMSLCLTRREWRGMWGPRTCHDGSLPTHDDMINSWSYTASSGDVWPRLCYPFTDKCHSCYLPGPPQFYPLHVYMVRVQLGRAVYCNYWRAFAMRESLQNDVQFLRRFHLQSILDIAKKTLI